MGWIISKALMNLHCSQEQAVESLAESSLDGVQSAELNGTPMQQVYLSPDKMTEFLRLSRFGMMCKPLTESRGEDLLTWYLEDFLARILAAQEREQDFINAVSSSEVRVTNRKKDSLMMYRDDLSLKQIIDSYSGVSTEDIERSIRSMKQLDAGSCSESCEAFSSDNYDLFEGDS